MIIIGEILSVTIRKCKEFRGFRREKNMSVFKERGKSGETQNGSHKGQSIPGWDMSKWDTSMEGWHLGTEKNPAWLKSMISGKQRMLSFRKYWLIPFWQRHQDVFKEKWEVDKYSCWGWLSTENLKHPCQGVWNYS